MSKSGEKLNQRMEEGLRALAEERVAVPRDFRASVRRELAKQAGIHDTWSASRWMERLIGFPVKNLLPLASGMAALALVVLFTHEKAQDPAVLATAVEKPEGVATARVERWNEQSLQGENKLARGSDANAEKTRLGAENEIAALPQAQEDPGRQRPGSFSMPQRIPRSLDPLVANPRPAPSAAPATAPTPQPRARAASEPIRVVITPQPTPMTHGIKGFSEARRNVFKPEQGEYVAILFNLDLEDHVSIRVFDLNGRLVTDLLDETRAAGLHEVRWTGHNGRGEVAGTGKYVVLVKARDGRQVARHKVALIR